MSGGRTRLGRRSAAPLLLLAAALLAGCGGGGGTSAPAPPPVPQRLLPAGFAQDVVLVTVDTLRADVLGFSHGEHRARTPMLDRLAAAGRVYSFAHSHNVVTLPSHASILTGLYPYQHGIRDNSGFVLPERVSTVATYLRRAGFVAGAFVAAAPLDARYGLGRDFDVYDDAYPKGDESSDFGVAERRGDKVVAPALAWWRQHGGQRRFLWVHLYDPHGPYQPPPPFAEEYAASPYLGEVAATDAFLAPLLEPFVSGAEKRPALVIVTGDHGESLGDHGEVTHGFLAYEPTLHIPLVLWAPGMPAGEVDEPARHVDLLPTMLDAAGLAPPEGLPGRSLLQPLAPGAPAPPSYFEALSPNLNRGWAPLRGMLEGDFKFISVPIPELYDVGQDPGEEHNVVDAQRPRARAMAALLPQESVWPPERGSVAPEEEARLRALGYVTGSAEAKAVYTERDDPKNLIPLDRKLHKTMDLYHEGRLDEAVALLEEIIGERPEMSLGYTYLAKILLRQDKLQRAISVMETAVRQGAASGSLLRQLALSLAEVGRPQEGVELLTPLAATDDPDVLNALGSVLSDAGRQEEARRTLARALELDPRSPLAHESLALVALRGGAWAAAREEAQRALAINDKLPLSWNYLGTALYNLGDKRQAIDALERCVAIDDGNYDALYNLGVVALEVRDATVARRALERFVRDAPAARYGPDIAQARAWLARLPS